MSTSPTVPPDHGPAATSTSTVRPGGTAVDPATGRPAGRVQLVLLLAVSCLSILGSVLIAPVLPQIQAAFATVPGVEVLVPIVLTVPALVIALTAPFAGLIADRFDRKRLLLVALVGYAVFGTAPLYLSTLPQIIGSRVLVGVCEAAIMTCATTLIGDYWDGEKRSRFLGLQTVVTAVAATVFLGLGGALGALGWRVPFWLYLVAALLVLPVARGIWQPARTRSAEGGTGARLPSVPWGLIAAPIAVTLFGGVVFYTLIVQLPFVLDGIGITDTGTIGLLSAVMSLATAIGAFVFGRVARRSPRVLLPVELVLAAVGLLLVFATTSVTLIAIGAVITGFGTGLLLPTMLTWAVNRLTFEQRGRGTGLFTAALFLGQFACPLVIAGIGAVVGGLQPALAVLGVVTLLVAGAAVVGLRGHDRPLNVSHT